MSFIRIQHDYVKYANNDDEILTLCMRKKMRSV